ncbi:hypothetical protein ACUDA5_01420 [Pseudomonas aeruginosa]|jgi:hypothetical protein|uniref:hypothetical protein n=1 Tax=Pseudomonas aeruginosa TaxID=287 RepID=UPI0006F6E865|nr:hypothetical protein [Pseudomonas sp. Leaf83]KQO33430.1 hypothetical protein ASF15_07920 [Pseudomonas sp. Leaf83]
MAVSFGIAKIISDHPSYNYGLALPFVISFYLLNSTNTYSIPLIDKSIGLETTAIIKMIGVIGYYFTFILFLLFSSGLSSLVKYSKLHLGWPVFTAAASIITLLFHDENPLFGVLFGFSSLIYLLFSKFDSGNLSIVLIQGIFGFFSIFCFVTGILWLNGDIVFTNIIAKLFGFREVAQSSIKVGAFMLIVLGYSIFYSLFKAGERWHPDAPSI